VHDIERRFGCAVSRMAIRAHRREKTYGRIDDAVGKIVEVVPDAVDSSKRSSAQKLGLQALPGGTITVSMRH
jgi:hypothetical protein